MPKPEANLQPDSDLFATSSDMIRIYFLRRDSSDGSFRQEGQHIELRHRDKYVHVITSFDWNQIEQNTIATASIDSTVAIWNLERQEITTHLVAHYKAAYDISFSLEETIFATVGEDCSLRLFDTRDLRS